MKRSNGSSTFSAAARRRIASTLRSVAGPRPRVGLLFDHLTNQQPGAVGQLEHLEADDVYRQVQAAQELLHALESGRDTDADERDGDLARPTVGFGVEKLSQPRRQHPGIAEPVQVGLELRAQFIGREPRERGRA